MKVLPHGLIFTVKARRSVGRLTSSAFDGEAVSAYVWAMKDAGGADNGWDNGETLGPSLALPPLYALRSVDYCPKCRMALHVYTLGCTAYHDAEDRRPVEQFHFLHHIRSVPEPVSALLKARCPGYYLDRTGKAKSPYLMNHCPCGARLDDEYLHGDVGAAFCPDTPAGFGDFRLFLLPIQEAIPVESSWTIGGGEYLNVALAESW